VGKWESFLRALLKETALWQLNKNRKAKRDLHEDFNPNIWFQSGDVNITQKKKKSGNKQTNINIVKTRMFN